MEWLKRYKLLILGGTFLFTVIVLGNRDDRPPAPEERPNPFAGRAGARPPQSAAERQPEPEPERALRGNVQQASDEPLVADVDKGAREEAAGESPPDSTPKVKPEVDLDLARREAAAEVEDFNRELASTLGTVNPNAFKMNLQAKQLRDRAESLEEWIETQDSRADMSYEEREKWKVRRGVWASHAKELKLVAQRLSATRGTKRKVRILAHEIAEKVEE